MSTYKSIVNCKEGDRGKLQKKCNLYMLSKGVWSLNLISLHLYTNNYMKLPIISNSTLCTFQIYCNLVQCETRLFPLDKKIALDTFLLNLDPQINSHAYFFPLTTEKLFINNPQDIIAFSIEQRIDEHSEIIDLNNCECLLHFSLTKHENCCSK